MSRMKTIGVAAALSSAIALALPAAAELYRYVDAEGELNIVSDLEMVPGQYRASALADVEERDGGSLNIVEAPSTLPPVSAAAPDMEADIPAPAATPSSDTSEIAGHDEFWWQSQANTKRSTIVDLKSQHEAAVEEEENWSEQLYRSPGGGPGGKTVAGPGGSRRAGNRNSRGALLLSAADDTEEVSVEDLEQQLEEAESDLERLHEQARSAGVPPGWLR
jgi:hypothetical protein